MSTLPVRANSHEFSPRPSHFADSPELYSSWRDYAFSHAPELLDDELPDPTPSEGNPTV